MGISDLILQSIDRVVADMEKGDEGMQTFSVNKEVPIKTYTRGEFSKLVGVSGRTLKRWDDDGKLIAGRTLSNRRFYTNEHLEIVRRGLVRD